ncbi:class I SAM-dependent methyltransferase [Nocardiopsis aegyptia]|uniref:class I SAM-dependent methyltransferase n=1 Tax=Nocardiopsis aegyptia TaxID=220378 RepID=UPI003672ECAD
MNHARGTRPDSTRPRTESEQEREQRDYLEAFYERGLPPWDTRVSPPELVDLVEGERPLPPGRALELGFGTGTNAVYLARHGWDVVGVDLVGRAVELARARAAEAGVAPRLLHGDATRLDEVDASGPFDLFFDLSCLCGIPRPRHDAYAAGLTRRAAPGAVLLMFVYGPGAFDDPEEGVSPEEVAARFTGWDLVDTTPGTNPFPTFWLTLRRL